MSGISGVGGSGMNSNMIKLLNQITSKGKSSKNNSTEKSNESFQISTSTTAPSMGVSSSHSYAAGRFTAKTHGSSMGFSANSITIPSFDGLTKGESQITAEELRDQLINLAEESAAKGEAYSDTLPQVADLIEKYICAFSPDRKGMLDEATNGKSFPDINGILAEITDNSNGLPIANYQPNQGWSTFWTQDERDAAHPFFDIYRSAFFGEDIPDVPSAPSSSGSTTGSTSGGSAYKPNKPNLDFIA